MKYQKQVASMEYIISLNSISRNKTYGIPAYSQST